MSDRPDHYLAQLAQDVLLDILEQEPPEDIPAALEPARELLERLELDMDGVVVQNLVGTLTAGFGLGEKAIIRCLRFFRALSVRAKPVDPLEPERAQMKKEIAYLRMWRDYAEAHFLETGEAQRCNLHAKRRLREGPDTGPLDKRSSS